MGTFEPGRTRALEPGDRAVLGLPADDRSSYLRGAAAAPGAIREALFCPSTNLAAEDGFDLGVPGAWRDLGDLDLGGNLDPEAVAAAVSAVAERGARLVCLGGDHSVTYPALRGHADGLRTRSPARRGIDVLHLDAHNDLYDEFEGDRLSHACPFARACEDGLVARLVQVGIRGMTGHLRSQAERFGVEVIGMPAWDRGVRPAFEGEFYLSLDLDALDPAFAPGVSHPEPGGLSMREVVGLIQTCPGILVGADIVELNPSRDRDGVTARAAAKLLKEILARLARGGASLEAAGNGPGRARRES